MTGSLKTAFGLGLASAALLAASCASSAPGGADTAANASGKACFYARNISSWQDVSPTVVNLRVNVSDYYQLKLLGDCPNIDWSQRIGIEHMGSSWICSGLDATLIVPQPGGAIPPLRCAVSSIRKLSPEEAKALPPKQKP